MTNEEKVKSLVDTMVRSYIPVGTKVTPELLDDLMLKVGELIVGMADDGLLDLSEDVTVGFTLRTIQTCRICGVCKTNGLIYDCISKVTYCPICNPELHKVMKCVFRE
jgi:hypothetical protein